MAISEKQKKILAFSYTKKYQALICDGAVRSGKTSIMTVAFIDWAMREFSDCNFAICGKTVGSAIKNIVSPYMAMSLTKKKYKTTFTRTENKLIVRKGTKVNTFYIYGGKDESSYMLIQGITLAGVLLDEVALMTRSFVEQALARCSVEGSRFWFNCNPEHPSHWFYDEWIKEENHEVKKILYLHFLMEDNPSLSKEVLDRYNSIYTGVFHDRYIKGLWVTAEGAIYRIFSENKDKYIKDFYHDLPTFRNPYDTEAWKKRKLNKGYIEIGVDYGGNKSGYSFVASWISKDYKTIHVLDSVRYMAKDYEAKYGKELTPTIVDDLIVEFILKIADKYRMPDYLRPDSERSDAIAGIRTRLPKENIPTTVVHCTKTKVFLRCELTNRLFSSGRLFITPECETLEKALDGAVWNSKKDDERLDDFTSDIDTMDAFEYTWTHYSKAIANR